MKRQIIHLVLLLAALGLAKPLYVKAEDQVCTTTYGGGVVCGAKAPEHKPVETGIEDIPGIFAALSMLTSGGIYMLSKRGNKSKESGVIYKAS